MDFAEKMKQAAIDKKNANIGGAAITELQQQLEKLNEDQKKELEEKKRIDAGLPAKPKKFNLAKTIEDLKRKQQEEDERKVIDPYTVKVRKFPNHVTEHDLREIFEKYGEITRIKVPMDQENPTRNKGIGFVTFKNAEDCTNVIESELIKYEFYELPCERAHYSANMAA